MKKDILEKKLFAYNDVFAEVFNDLVFYGTGIVIDPDDLLDTRERSRADYRSQIVERDEALRAARIMNDKTALQELRGRKFYPVITAVLYYGIKKRWSKPRSLYDCLEMPPGFERIVEDRRMNVIELAWISDEQEAAMKSDMRFVVNMLKQIRTTGKYIPPNGYAIRHVETLMRLLHEFTGRRDLYNEMLIKYHKVKAKGGRVEMIDLVGALLEQGRSEGRAEGLTQGRAEGVTQGRLEERAENLKSTLVFLKEIGVSQENIARYMAMHSDVMQIQS